jgi:hypothetical protein
VGGTTLVHEAPRATPDLAAVEESTGQSTARAIGIQRVSRVDCADCGGSVVRAPRARGPLARRCQTCVAARRPKAQLRAYLRSAGRLAQELGLDPVAAATGAAITILDGITGPAIGTGAVCQAPRAIVEDRW